jgi:hypothetical protein
MQDDIFLAFLDRDRERLLRLRRLKGRIARTRDQIERSRIAIAYSRLLLTMRVVKLFDNERPPPSQSN